MPLNLLQHDIMTKLPSAVKAKITNKTTICLKLVIAISLEGDNLYQCLKSAKT